jgi:iron complex transport system substrate-binding protein
MKGTPVRSRLLAAVAAASLTATLAACSTSAADEGGSEGEIEIEHAFGTTVIPEKPERIATVAWMNHEVPLALDVVPVGMSKATWGDDDGNGVLPWVEDKLEELGADTPVLFDETDGIDFEAVADTEPDVILASYSGLTEEEYETLSKIAPTVAYPEIAWGTSVEDMVRMNSEAIGMAEEGEALVEDLDAQIAESMAAHDSLEGAKPFFAFMDPSDFSTIGYYTSLDTRVGFLEQAGMGVPQLVEEETAGTDQFYLEISAEEADQLEDVDVFITYGDPDGDLVAQMQADPLLSQIPAIKEGRVAILPDATPIAASANQSPLSIPWGIDDYFDIIADAAAQGQ